MALQELESIERTLLILDWLQSVELRRTATWAGCVSGGYTGQAPKQILQISKF